MLNRALFLTELADLMEKHRCAELYPYMEQYGGPALSFEFENAEDVDIALSLTPQELRRLAENL